jgi:hypothetical protein
MLQLGEIRSRPAALQIQLDELYIRQPSQPSGSFIFLYVDGVQWILKLCCGGCVLAAA